MSDLQPTDTISRQAAIDEMQEYWRSLNLRRKRIPLAAESVYMDLKGVVATLPSAQPEIIRCKDCKFGNISSMGHLAVCGHEKGLVDPVPDSYCSYAERRTDD